jgi:hypothetical protein
VFYPNNANRFASLQDMELVVRPATHCKQGLTAQQVVNILHSEAARLFSQAEKDGGR